MAEGIIGGLDRLMHLGERLHFISAIIPAFLGEKPADDAPASAKAAYYMFGLGKTEERRIGAILRKIAAEVPKDDDADLTGAEKVKIFLNFCEWLTAHNKDLWQERVEAATVRDAFFVYIAKVDETTSQPQKVGTSTQSLRSTLTNPNDATGRRTITRTINRDEMSKGGASQGVALVKEIVEMIRDYYGKLAGEGDARWEQAFHLTQQRLVNSRGIPCYKVGDTEIRRTIEWVRRNHTIVSARVQAFANWAKARREERRRRRESDSFITRAFRNFARFGRKN